VDEGIGLAEGMPAPLRISRQGEFGRRIVESHHLPHAGGSGATANGVTLDEGDAPTGVCEALGAGGSHDTPTDDDDV
jgi:hypothetical protein